MYSIQNWLAQSVAGLTLGVALISTAVADDFTLSLPQGVDDSVTLTVPDEFVAEPADILKVFLGTAEKCCKDRIPVAGGYVLENNLLSFTPAFGFNAGATYVARVEGAQNVDLTSFSITPDAAASPAAVTRIFPSGDVLPENTLRFYIHFSVPMMPGAAFDYIKLRDISGTADEAAFMRFKQELWNEDRTRLTVLIDPGRIKRKVATNIDLGPALQAGQTYSITVDGGWPTADGTSVLPAFAKAFQVSDALREQPDARLWTANAPCAGTKEALTLSFDRAFDRHLLTQTLRLETGSANSLNGTVQIGHAERSWSFVPHRPWTKEDIHLIASPVLEDVAGNNFYDLLDHAAGLRDVDPSSTSLPVRIRECTG